MHSAIIGVGSNLNPDKNIKKAESLLSEDHNFISKSKFVKTEPIGNNHQPDFLNGAFLIETKLEFEEFKNYLKSVEKKLGRTDAHKNQNPRPIDLDIVVWDLSIVESDFFTRSFVKEAVLDLI